MITKKEFVRKIDNLIDNAILSGIQVETINKILEENKIPFNTFVLRTNPYTGRIEPIEEK